MIPLIYEINHIYQADINELDPSDEEFFHRIHSDFLFDDEKEQIGRAHV